MSFISYEFLVFFPVVIGLYWLVPKTRWQNFIIAAASLIFYGWLAAWHVVVLFFSILADYLLALGIVHWKSRSSLLMWVGIGLNLVLLASVKYYFTYDDLLAVWAAPAGIKPEVFSPSFLLLPVGASFYTLKKISYLVDVQRGTMLPERDLISFTAFVSFFPQVLSGPIDRPRNFLKQLEVPRVWASAHFYNSWQLLLMGLLKKLVIANTVKVFVDQIFLMKEPSKIFLIVGGLGFTLQILADFSSYTDLSRGLAFLLGLNTTENFDKPYLALTPTDFWNRWHISFSSWLRDYIFFPIRRMLLRITPLPDLLKQILPPLITMLISGLWHGTGLTFIIWGGYYGVLIIIYQLHGIRATSNPLQRFFAWAGMFSLIVFGWLIFRATSIQWLWNALTVSPFFRSTNELIASFVLLVMISFYAALMLFKHALDVHAPQRISLHAAYYVLALVMTIIFMNSSSPDFIYFQF